MKTPLYRFVMGLLLAAASLVVWVGVQTVRASREVSGRQALDYRTFLGALDELLEQAGDSALVEVHPVEARITGSTMAIFDTLAIVADVKAFPSLDRAGFLYDQVRAYNRFQRDRLSLAREFPEWFQRLRAYNPSVFRSHHRADGTLGLTRASSAWSLRVRSPLEGDWTGQVLAEDVHRGQGLLSPRVTLSLRKPVRLQREVDGRRQVCELTPSSLEIRAYCLSEARIPQAIFRLASGNRMEGGWAVAGWDDLWVDGHRIRAGDSIGIPGGTLLRLNPLEPVVFAEYWEGVLSTRQWINGRMQRSTELSPPLDLFSPLGWGPVPPDSRDRPRANIRLSVRSDVSMALSDEFSTFLDREVDIPLESATLVLARVPDGEIVAIAEAGQRKSRDRSPLLERVAPGSAVKPLLAAAILSERPDLATMEIRARSGRVTSVMGLPPVPNRRAFSTALNCAFPRSGTVDLQYFLRCSNNEFAASLLVAGLEPSGSGNPANTPIRLPLVRGQVPREVLLRSPLSQGLHSLFDLATDPTIADSTGRSRRNWDGLVFADGTPAYLPWELLPDESRPALLASGTSQGTDLALLYRYAFGAWENRWTLLDLTTGCARVVTDQKLQLRVQA